MAADVGSGDLTMNPECIEHMMELNTRCWNCRGAEHCPYVKHESQPIASMTVTLTIKLEEVEADGSSCFACRDLIFLTGFIYTIYVGSRRAGQVDNVMLCQACGQAIKDEMECTGRNNHEQGW